MGICDYYRKKKDIEGNPISIPTKALKVISDLSDKCICKIKLNEKGTATGFFCAIPFPDKFNRLPVLITNNHVLEGEDIIRGKIIKFSLNNEKLKYDIKIDKDRKKYTNEKYDITMIEIKKDIDKINLDSFLDVDEDIFKENYKNIDKEPVSVYLLHYPHGTLLEYSSGIIKGFILDDNDDSFTFKHTCQTKAGSSGSPIINLISHKVIGIHKGYKENKNYNLGTILKEPIKDFYSKKNENLSSNIILYMKKYNLNFEELNKLLVSLKDSSLFEPLLNYYKNKRVLYKIQSYSKHSYLNSIGFDKNIMIFEYIFDICYNFIMIFDEDSFDREIYNEKLESIIKLVEKYTYLTKINFKNIYNELIKQIADIKNQIIYSNYKCISLKELEDIEYNIGLIKSNFTQENILLLDKFYNKILSVINCQRKK